jgi:hypothetical protein
LALGPDYPVFVSSDFRSIPGGKPWFAEIVNALQTASAELVLVSHASVDQRWLNFEAGIGVGAGIPVMPLLISGFTKAEFNPPLSQLQTRDLSNREDFNGMIADLTEIFGKKWGGDAAQTLFVNLEQICRELNNEVVPE